MKTKRNKILFEILPIAQLKGKGLMLNYRFECIPPYNSRDAKLLFLNTEKDEGLLLFDAKQKTVIGYQLGENKWYVHNNEIVDINYLRNYTFYISPDSNHIVSRIYRYVKKNSKEIVFRKLATSFVKAGLNASYKKLQRHKSFDMGETLGIAINKALEDDKEIGYTFQILKEYFLTTPQLMFDFIWEFAKIGDTLVKDTQVEFLPEN